MFFKTVHVNAYNLKPKMKLIYSLKTNYGIQQLIDYIMLAILIANNLLKVTSPYALAFPSDLRQ